MVLLQRLNLDPSGLLQGLLVYLLLLALAGLHLLPDLEPGDRREPQEEDLDHPPQPGRCQERHRCLHRISLLGTHNRL